MLQGLRGLPLRRLETTRGGSLPGLLLAGFARASQPLAGGKLLIDLDNVRLFNLALDSTGAASLQVIIQAGPTLVGLGAVLQYASLDASQPQGLALSNGLEFVICAE